MRSLILALLLSAASATLTFQLEPKSAECFGHNLKSGEKFVLDYEVTRGGLLDVKFRLTSPNGKVIIDRMGFFNKKTDEQIEREGHMEHIATESGEYEICFDNRMSRWTAKVISFGLTGMNKNSGTRSDEFAKLEHLGPVVDSIITITDSLDSITKLQHHMRVLERNAREGTRNTNSRVQWLAIFETVVLFAISYFQIRSIRKWFMDSDSKSSRGSARGRV